MLDDETVALGCRAMAGDAERLEHDFAPLDRRGIVRL